MEKESYCVRESKKKIKCSKGHEFWFYEVWWLSFGNKKYCLRCLEEKIVPILEEMGIGTPLKEQEKEDLKEGKK